MTECRTRYRWAAEWEDPLVAREMIPVLEPVVESWLLRKKIFSDPLLIADPYGRIVLSITVRTRDRWTNHNRAMYFAAAIAARAKVKLRALGEPLYLPLPPHRNRGQGRRGLTGWRRPCKVLTEQGPCTRDAHTRGMCQPHYQKDRYWGDPLGGPWLKEVAGNGTGDGSGVPVESVHAADGTHP
jgi:hypothetical protein